MIEPSVKMSYNGGPMEKLNELIEKRKKWLGETYKDAITATAITALTSIRAATRPYSGIVGTGFFCSVIRRNDVHPAFTGAGHVRCFRVGRFPRRNAHRVDLGSRCVQLVPPGDNLSWRQASVWKVTVSKERVERWRHQPLEFHVAAMGEDSVRAYLERRFGHIAERQGGLARTVLGVAMAKISTRPPANEKAGRHVKQIVQKYAVATQRDSGESFSVHVESNLSYATDALKGGSGAVDAALKSAANRIAGMIRHKAGASLDEDLSTPFPEVKRK